MVRKILHTVDEVTRYSNTPNVLSLLMKIKIPDGVSYTVDNPTRFFVKLFSALNVQIPNNSSFFFAAQKPGIDFPTFFVKNFYAPYFDLTTAQQRNAEGLDATTLRVGNLPQITLREGDEFQIWINSPVVVDMTLAGTTFEFDVRTDN